MNKNSLKKELEHLPDCDLETLENAWVEIIIKRTEGNKRQAARLLDISLCKLRGFIISKRIDMSKLPYNPVGRPKEP